MGKPRLIILIRHAQSEGNKNREIHQVIPDHRVKLTDEGRTQAEEAGQRLRALLRPDDTLQFFTSPYRRTRETTEGILRTLTAADKDGKSSPFSKDSITVYEEPRIREQDFGNFQPCSAEMSRMWQERADYGHFFYRIPNGESAADAYDRIAGFNESLWRQFNEPDFPSVCVLVTHGLMTRVFLMKWYHWSVEYFEDLRNINHCEFITMERNEIDKYALKNQLRTWSELKRQKMEEAVEEEAIANAPLQDPLRRNTLSQYLPVRPRIEASPQPTPWGGCIGGCKHNHDKYPRRALQDSGDDITLPSPADASSSNSQQYHDYDTSRTSASISHVPLESMASTSDKTRQTKSSHNTRGAVPSYLLHGRDGGGTDTPPTPTDNMSEAGEYFEAEQALGRPHKPQRTATSEDYERWAHESGMGKGTKADALGDEAEDIVDEVERDVENERAYEDSVLQSVY